MHFAATTTCSPSASPADMMVAEEIQELLSKLKELVPNMPRNKKLSKLEIIQYVIDYIDDLQSALESHPSVAGQFSSFQQQRSPVVNNTSCGQVRQPLSTISISEKRSFTDDTMRSNKKMSWILQDLSRHLLILSSYSSALSFSNPRTQENRTCSSVHEETPSTAQMPQTVISNERIEDPWSLDRFRCSIALLNFLM